MLQPIGRQDCYTGEKDYYMTLWRSVLAELENSLVNNFMKKKSFSEVGFGMM